MTRDPVRRRQDVLDAIARCLDYREHLMVSEAGIASMAYDAVLRNLAVIGEAVRALPPEAKASAPAVPWASIAGLRNVVVHEYFRVDPAVIAQIVDDDLVPLAEAIRAMGNDE